MQYNRTHVSIRRQYVVAAGLIAICMGCATPLKKTAPTPAAMPEPVASVPANHGTGGIDRGVGNRNSVDSSIRRASVRKLVAIDRRASSEKSLAPEPSPPVTSSRMSNPTVGYEWSEVAHLLDPSYETVLPLDSETCYVRAMASTSLGILVDLERQLQQCLNASKHSKQQQQVILDRLLCYRAEQERNSAAGTSLEAFYNLAEVESQKELLQRTSAATERLAMAADRVKDSGVNAKIDTLGIKLQALEVKRRFSELQKNESTLQFNLRHLIGESPSAPLQLVPTVESPVSFTPRDRAALFSTAIESRAELKALNYLLSLRGEDSLSATRQQLRGSDPSLGSRLPGIDCIKLLAVLFSGSDNQVEACCRAKQLDELRSETVRLIEVEVSAAYFAVCHRLQRLALAQQEANHRAKYIEQLEAARNTENYQYQDLADARIRLLAAESAVIHERYALRIDESNLIRAQGLYCE